jgi:hypothetical protein
LIAPFALTALLGLSAYVRADANARALRDYRECLDRARAYAADDIEVDAAEQYKKALDIRPSLELRMEIAEFYASAGRTGVAAKWCEDAADAYPGEPAPYEYLMKMRLDKGDIASCFELYDTMTRRGTVSEACEEIMERLEYSYYMAGDYEDVASFAGGYCAVMTKGAWGYIGETGARSVESRFARAGQFGTDGRAAVTDAHGKSYYIDADGNKRIAPPVGPNADSLGLLENGVYTLGGAGGWRIYDLYNNPASKTYDYITSIRDGRAAALADGLWSLVDAAGNPVSGDGYDGVKSDGGGAAYSGGRWFALSDGMYQMLDGEGRRVSDGEYEDCAPFAAEGGLYAAVKFGGGWGFVDGEGDCVIEPRYAGARSFSYGLAAVKLDGKWGYIDAAGDMVIENVFSDVRDFNKRGCALVRADGRWKMLKLYKYNYGG